MLGHFCSCRFKATRNGSSMESSHTVARPFEKAGSVHPSRSQCLFLLIATLPFLSVSARAQIDSKTSSPADPQQQQTGENTSEAAPGSSAPDLSAPLSMPAMAGPLATAAPTVIDAGFGKVDVTGVVSGFGYAQNHYSPGDRAGRGDLSNGQIFVQKPNGIVQYFLQAGVYNIPILGAPGLSTRSTISDLYGPLPQAYLKLASKGAFSFQIGKLPTLIGAEYTFTFENLNIERGLLWNQENAVNRGLQVNYSKAKLSSSLSWNDGFYSNRYNWLTGTATYAFSPTNSLQAVAGGNFGHTRYSTTATPLYQNNGSIYDAIYTHTAKKWMIQPYFQYTRIPADTRIGVDRTTSTISGAVLGSYTFTPHVSLTGRAEYISTTGSASDGSANLLYGPGSRAWSVTLTPTYLNKAFFARAEFSASYINNYTPGDAFGSKGLDASQIRGLVETGFMF